MRTQTRVRSCIVGCLVWMFTSFFFSLPAEWVRVAPIPLFFSFLFFPPRASEPPCFSPIRSCPHRFPLGKNKEEKKKKINEGKEKKREKSVRGEPPRRQTLSKKQFSDTRTTRPNPSRLFLIELYRAVLRTPPAGEAGDRKGRGRG